ncbi:hypothetical protein UFOVP637_16 [uncultured Caudovirales phage]|uniref:Uncharacterized protein n=1 Tax=uncultured Caudovirales phage TaxID=2100421 RepID=A0A6J5MQL1_9CAUD|nr:hypothetical protein UFOVP534_43 [uncultured Caudovirales phage]CAB4154076.1 hypothetical protein UFOVP637_16 [uncultured Caudovirales phage]
MARLVLTNAQVVFGTNSDLSDHISSLSLQTSYDIVETTSFGNVAKTRVAGLQDNSVTFEFHQDYATSSVEQIIYPLLGTAVTCTVKPVNGSVSATNPSYSFSVLISEWTPLNGGVGELATASVTWPISGAITKATS